MQWDDRRDWEEGEGAITFRIFFFQRTLSREEEEKDPIFSPLWQPEFWAAEAWSLFLAPLVDMRELRTSIWVRKSIASEKHLVGKRVNRIRSLQCRRELLFVFFPTEKFFAIKNVGKAFRRLLFAFSKWFLSASFSIARCQFAIVEYFTADSKQRATLALKRRKI